MDRAEHPVAVRVELAAVGLDQPREGILAARLGPLEQVALLGFGNGGTHPHAD